MSNYYVVMQDFGRRGREATVDPEMTQSNIIDRIATGEYKNIVFVHHVYDGVCEDVTEQLIAEAGVEDREYDFPVDHAAATADHTRDLRKHEVV